MRVRGLCKLPAGRWTCCGENSLSLVGRATLCKSLNLIVCWCVSLCSLNVRFLFFFFPKVTQSWIYRLSVVGLMATSKKTKANMCLPALAPSCLHPHSRPLPTQTPAGDCQTLTGRSGSVSFGGHCSISWVLICTRFCLVPSKSLCFPSPLKDLSESFPWPPVLAGSPGREIWCDA